MKSFILASALIALVWAVGCAKKDDGGGGPPAAPCGAQAVWSPGLSQCLAQAQCPIGLAQSAAEPTMCVDVRTGQNAQVQQCGVGFFLTASGCLPQGECQSGKAMRGDVCVPIVAASGSNWTGQQTPQTGMQYNPYGAVNPGYGNGMQVNPYAGYFRF